MTTSTLAPPAAPAVPHSKYGFVPPALAPWLHRFSVDDYHRMIQTGILSEDEKVELLNGWIVQKMTRNPPHDMAVGLVHDELRAVLPAEWVLRGQCAVTTSESEPEPDVAVVRGPHRRYAANHPGPGDTGLVIEVADSSLDRDRTVKGPIYARDNVPVYWIVNIPDDLLEVYTDPSGPADEPAYRQHRDYRRTEAVPVILDGREVGTIRVRDLLPDETRT
jgi:Uma2 family endonuclease